MGTTTEISISVSAIVGQVTAGGQLWTSYRTKDRFTTESTERGNEQCHLVLLPLRGLRALPGESSAPRTADKTGMHAMLAIMTPEGYRLGFGDNDFEGWLITIAYFVAAGLCTWAWRGEQALGTRDAVKARPLVWAGLVALLVPLGFNKQLDLQHWLIFAVRDRLSTDASLWSHRYVIGAAVGGA